MQFFKVGSPWREKNDTAAQLRSTTIERYIQKINPRKNDLRQPARIQGRVRNVQQQTLPGRAKNTRQDNGSMAGQKIVSRSEEKENNIVRPSRELSKSAREATQQRCNFRVQKPLFSSFKGRRRERLKPSQRFIESSRKQEETSVKSISGRTRVSCV